MLAAVSSALRPANSARAVLEAVLGDRVAAVAAVEQPGGEVGAALEERVQVGRGDHEQRHAVDAVVGEPVADQRAALERRRLDVVDARPRSAARALMPPAARAAPSVGQRAPPARGEPPERRLPGALAHRREAAARQPLAHRARAGQARDRAGQRLGARRAQQPAAAVGDQLGGPAGADRHHREAGRLRLEHDLAERVGLRAEQEQVGRRVGGGERVAVEPAEERRRTSEPRPQPRLLGPAAGEHEVQPRVARAGGEERVGEQVGALLAREPAGVEHVDAVGGRRPGSRRAGEKRAMSTPRSQRAIRSGAMPSSAQRSRPPRRTGERTTPQRP